MYSIEIEPHNCTQCYRCVRACSVKAIQIQDEQASIRQSECVGCGNCLESCPHDMIRLRDDTAMVARLIKRSQTVVASLHPDWITEFTDIEPYRMIEALHLMGFAHVSQAELGREVYKATAARHLDQNRQLTLSGECPVAVRLIQTKFPEYAKYIAPIAHPAVLHARMIRWWWGAETKVVHITPCVAMKPGDLDQPNEIDAVITFKELRKWMYDEGVEFDFIPGNDTYRFEPYYASFVSDSLIQDAISFDGLRKITAVMNQLQVNESRPVSFLELFSCRGGCIEGLGISKSGSPIDKVLSYRRSRKRIAQADSSYRLPTILTHTDSYEDNTLQPLQIAESEIEAALRTIGKTSRVDLLNCNACGYDHCRDFARSMVEGKSSPDMCLAYSRNLAHRKFTALLDSMPSSVMLVDHNLKIVEANANMAATMGADAILINEANRGMKGADLQKLISFTPLISSVLVWGRDVIENDVHIDDRLLKISIFSIETHQLVCVVISNLLAQEIRGDEMVNRTREVIRENLLTVQKIAYLLGENASRTEALLNSIVEK